MSAHEESKDGGPVPPSTSSSKSPPLSSSPPSSTAWSPSAAPSLLPARSRADSSFHRVATLYCPSCLYLEFPGCLIHNGLLCTQKGNGFMSCSGCEEERKRQGGEDNDSVVNMICATDLSEPWSIACQHCNVVRADTIPWVIEDAQSQALAAAIDRETADVVPHLVIQCDDCKTTVFPIRHSHLTHNDQGRIRGRRDEHSPADDTELLSVDDFPFQHYRAKCGGQLRTLPILISKLEGKFCGQSLPASPCLPKDDQQAPGFIPPLQWVTGRVAEEKRAEEKARNESYLLSALQEKEWQAPVWRDRSYVGEFGDVFVRDTELEGGMLAPSIASLDLVARRILQRRRASWLAIWPDADVHRLSAVLDVFTAGTEVAMLAKASLLALNDKDVDDAGRRARVMAVQLRFHDLLHALPPGGTLILPGGWIAPKGGHGIMHCILHHADGSFSFTVSNTGGGLPYHPSQTGTPKTRFQCTLRFDGISRARMLDDGFWLVFWRLQLVSSDDNDHHVIYDVLIPHLTGGTVAATLSTQDEACEYRTPQRAGNCIAAGTLVALADGRSVPVEEVQEGDQVLSYNAALIAGETEGLVVRQVDAVLDQGRRKCVELLFSDGRTLVCTPDHRIRTADGRWVEAKDLVVGTDEVAVGVEYPNGTLKGEQRSSWRLATRATLGYDLDVAERAPESLAFARLLGFSLTDGYVHAAQIKVALGTKVRYYNARPHGRAITVMECPHPSESDAYAAVTVAMRAALEMCASGSVLMPAVDVTSLAVPEDDEEEEAASRVWRHPSTDKITYGVHRSDAKLPLFRVRLVGRRDVGKKHVYDLSVPSPQGDVSRSFTANGIVVHNCYYKSVLECFRYLLRRQGLSRAQAKQLAFCVRREYLEMVWEDLVCLSSFQSQFSAQPTPLHDPSDVPMLRLGTRQLCYAAIKESRAGRLSGDDLQAVMRLVERIEAKVATLAFEVEYGSSVIPQLRFDAGGEGGEEEEKQADTPAASALSFPGFECFHRNSAADQAAVLALAGAEVAASEAAEVDYINLPSTAVQTLDECLALLDATVLVCSVTSDADSLNAAFHRLAYLHHVLFSLLPAPLPRHRDSACAWLSRPLLFREQQRALHALLRLARQYMAAAFSLDFPANFPSTHRVLALASLVAIADRVLRSQPADTPNPVSATYAGLDPDSVYGPSLNNGADVPLAALTASQECLDPQVAVARGRVLEYFNDLERSVKRRLFPYPNSARHQTTQYSSDEPTLQFVRDVCAQAGYVIDRRGWGGKELSEVEAVTQWLYTDEDGLYGVSHAKQLPVLAREHPEFGQYRELLWLFKLAMVPARTTCRVVAVKRWREQDARMYWSYQVKSTPHAHTLHHTSHTTTAHDVAHRSTAASPRFAWLSAAVLIWIILH